MMEQQVNRTEEESKYRWFFLLSFSIENNFCSHIEIDSQTNVDEERKETEWEGSRKEERDRKRHKSCNSRSMNELKP